MTTVLLAWPLAARAATTGASVLPVPSLAYPTLADAVAAAADGDRIEVDGSYVGADGALLVDRALVIVGIEGRPVLRTTAADGLFVVDAGGSLVLDHVRFEGEGANRAIHLVAGNVTLLESEIVAVHNDADGGAVYVENDPKNALEVVDCTFDGASAQDGGFLAAVGGAITISGSSFANGAAERGGHLFTEANASVDIDRSTFLAGATSKEGGAIRANGPLTVKRSTFLDNVGAGGGAIRAAGGVTVTDSWFEGNDAVGAMKHGGAVWQEGGTGSYARTFFCDNHATKWGAALFEKGGDLTASQVVFALNRDDFAAPALRVEDDPATLAAHDVSHATFAANAAVASPGQAVTTGGALVIRDSWFGWHASNATIAATAGNATVTWTTFSDNDVDASAEVDVTDPQNVLSTAQPAVLIAAPGSACDLLALAPPAGSALVGTASDLDNRGAFLAIGWPDVDGDGFLYVDDCDDEAQDVHSWATEIPADGIDQDCSGTETCYADVDRDGAGETDLVTSDDLDCVDPGEAPAPDDACLGYDDRIDGDDDGVPDGCDTCQDGPNVDTDGDTVCDTDDQCPGYDDLLDTDTDGVPNGCEDCYPLDDTDGDGVPDNCDLCEGYPDSANADGDGVPDDCDPCPADAPDDDLDDDGVCNTDDACPGADDGEDSDFDQIPDGCDDCPDEAGDDSDGDGVCDPLDACPLDVENDADGDGRCASEDPCPTDPDPDCGPALRSGSVQDLVVGCGCGPSGRPGLAAAIGLALAAYGRRRRAR